MESALTPREIQARLRAGDSVEQVAAAAGVDTGHIDSFAGPVLAEREHAAQLARTAQVRRRGETSAHRKLADTVLDKLAKQDVAESDVTWDAWRDADKQWTVVVRWPNSEGGEANHAEFEFDQRGCFSVAKDDAARHLIGDVRTQIVSRPDPDSEPTVDLHDELAIVRAVQDEPAPPAVVADQNPQTELGRIVNLSEQIVNEPQDWVPAQLEQVDGVYDIVPNRSGEMDVLYDMLAGFNEDSVRIYTGLTRPPSEPHQTNTAHQASEAHQTSEPNPAADGHQPASPPTKAAAPATAVQSPRAGDDENPTNQGPTQPASEPQQDALVEEPADETVHARPHRSKSRRRASVPSWDEIMFGGPRSPKQD